MSSRPRRARTLLALAVALVTAGCARGPEAPPTSMDQDVPLEGWIRVESPGIEIVSAADESRTLALARELQIFRALARSLTGVRTEPRLPTRAFLFPDARAFHYFAADGIEGQFRQYPSGCLLLLSADDPEARHVLFHEYVHFLLHNQAVGYPKWYDEGLAELLGGVRIREHLVTVGAMVGREGTLANPDALLPLETVIGARSYADAGTRVSGFYAQSWLLTHLLTLGRHAGYPKRLDALRRYLAALQTAPDWRTAFDTYFPEGLEALSRDLESYRQRAVSGSTICRGSASTRASSREPSRRSRCVRSRRRGWRSCSVRSTSISGPRRRATPSDSSSGRWSSIRDTRPRGSGSRVPGRSAARSRTPPPSSSAPRRSLPSRARCCSRKATCCCCRRSRWTRQTPPWRASCAPARAMRSARAVSLDPDAIEAQVLLGRTYLTDEASVAEGLRGAGASAFGPALPRRDRPRPGTALRARGSARARARAPRSRRALGAGGAARAGDRPARRGREHYRVGATVGRRPVTAGATGGACDGSRPCCSRWFSPCSAPAA